MISFMVFMETLVSVSIAVGGCGAAGSIAFKWPCGASVGGEANALGTGSLAALSAAVSQAQRTAMQRSTAVLSHLHSRWATVAV